MACIGQSGSYTFWYRLLTECSDATGVCIGTGTFGIPVREEYLTGRLQYSLGSTKELVNMLRYEEQSLEGILCFWSAGIIRI